MAKKAGLTRRMNKQYQAILDGDANSWFWENPRANIWSSRKVPLPEANAWQAYYFARRWYGRDIDLRRLQSIVARKGTAECVTLYARNVPGANVRKLQKRLLKVGTPSELREFARLIPGSSVRLLENWAVVMESMQG